MFAEQLALSFDCWGCRGTGIAVVWSGRAFRAQVCTCRFPWGSPLRRPGSAP